MTTACIAGLFEDLEKGALAVTASRRLARQVSQRYADWKVTQGARAWPTPEIRAWDDWLVELWQWGLSHHPGAPRLLSDEQEQLLWEQVIRRHGSEDTSRLLLQLSGTAQAVRRTWQRLHEWRLDSERLRTCRSVDTEAFLGWTAALRRILHDRGWLTRAELAGYLGEHADAWLPGSGRPVWWMGFDVTTPAHEGLMTLLEGNGCPQHRFDNAGFESAGTVVVECGDADEEWQRAARWARAELEANPGQSLGIVCPDLRRHRDRIEEILEDVLHPELAWKTDAPRSYHLSLGRPLPDYPLVSAALDLLRCMQHRIPFDVVSRVLRSPYLHGAAEEWVARACFEVTLRREQQETFSSKRLATLAERHTGLETLCAVLNAVIGIDLPERGGAGDWAARIAEWLRAFGWPGERPQNSQEYQTVAAWREQLSGFAALGAVQDRWTRSEALKQLTAMAGTRVLQFHDDQAPLQVMGADEAAGLWFDKLWLADMSDAVWPPPARPDPFIPVTLQKACGMPEGSAEAMLAHTRIRTANMLAGAAETRVSFAARDADAPASLSPLFDPGRGSDPDAEEVYPGRVAQLAAAAPPLQDVDEQRAPPLSGNTIRGGVGVVADQARCPFRALAHHRLQAEALTEVVPGLSPMERGILVHQVAHAVWERLKNSEALAALDQAARRRQVADCVKETLAHRFADSLFQERFLEIEADRLTDLFLEWLELESGRAPFRVAAMELNTRVTLGGVTFSLRVDRIDELEDGRRLIMDYKTGRLDHFRNVREWVDPRMEEPQLPMYALGVDEGIAALALARVRRGECDLRGVADGAEGIPGLKPVSNLEFADMAALQAWWRPTLDSLVADHRRGVATVSPRRRDTCRTCDAMSLCRIFEGVDAGDE